MWENTGTESWNNLSVVTSLRTYIVWLRVCALNTLVYVSPSHVDCEGLLFVFLLLWFLKARSYPFLVLQFQVLCISTKHCALISYALKGEGRGKYWYFLGYLLLLKILTWMSDLQEKLEGGYPGRKMACLDFTMLFEEPLRHLHKSSSSDNTILLSWTIAPKFSCRK